MSRKMRQPQEIKIINNFPKLVKENFTVRFSKGGEAPLWMQDGAVFDDSGNEVSNVPEWIWEEHGKLSDEAKSKLKMTIPAMGKAK